MNRLGTLILFISVAIAANAETCAEKNARRLEEVDGVIMPGFELETCLPDGTYAAKQCRFGGCICYSAEGVVLVKFTRKNTQDMNCECARAKHESRGLLGAEFRCDEQTGNYLPMQCKGSVCYCADAHGNQLGDALPRHESSVQNMNCECIRAKHESRGLFGAEFRCNEKTGNYLPMQCKGSVCYCADAHGNQLGDALPRQESNILNMNCECARAKHESRGLLGVEFRCDDTTGNYLPMQCKGSMCYCTDSHGHQEGDAVPRQEADILTC